MYVYCVIAAMLLECELFKNWLIKCQDDSETFNYISANTKDVSLLNFVLSIMTNHY